MYKKKMRSLFYTVSNYLRHHLFSNSFSLKFLELHERPHINLHLSKSLLAVDALKFFIPWTCQFQLVVQFNMELQNEIS